MNAPDPVDVIEAAVPARRRSRQARVAWGEHVVTVGGDAPVRVQAMTNTDTVDVIGTAIQVKELAQAGSELVRITVNTPEAAAAVLMVAALVVYFLPPGLWSLRESAPAAASAPVSGTLVTVVEPAAPAASAASVADVPPPAAQTAASAPQAAGETVFSAPAPEAAASAAEGNASGPVQLRTTEPSWVDVRDANGQVLLSRTVLPGESVGLDGALPIRLVIGNAAATRLGFRGRPVDLAPRTRDNVARVELP